MMRPNRCQPQACHAAIAAVLGIPSATALLQTTGIAALPEQLPSGPRSAASLQAELRPFSVLFRALEEQTDRKTALAITRQAIIDSGSVSHATSAEAQPSKLAANIPLVPTSPPPVGFVADPALLQAGFDLAMQFFACEGELQNYSADLVRFSITSCHWCSAMHAEATPELIPFFCETDERFMDGHPTHTLRRPTAIGLGDSCCDFQFVRRNSDA